MLTWRRHLDPWSLVVILVTFFLFAVALLVEGIGHGLLLEAGVFLVSVKLILMAYRNSVTASDVNHRIEMLQATLERIEKRLATDGKTPAGGGGGRTGS